MTGKIKLNAASGGGSVSFQAPSSTGDDRIITLPTTADGTVLTTTNPKTGNIIQVVQQTKTGTSSFSIASGATYDHTQFAASITPTSTSSKILVQIMVNHGTSSNQIVGIRLMINGVCPDAAKGNANGSRARLTASYHAEETAGCTVLPITFLHSPNSTSQQTYNLNYRHNSSSTRTHYINRSHDDNNASGNGMGPRPMSTIILQEVAG